MSNDSHSTRLRRLVRKAGVGRFVLRTQQFLTLGPWKKFREAQSKKKILLRLLSARPIPCASTGPEVHMLLQHTRVYEGAWAYYSLARFLPSRLVIHDDGSMSVADEEVFDRLFPGYRLIRRADADEQTNRYFDEHGLGKCRELRDSLPLALKVFDVALLAQSERVLILDSDVLFFKECPELNHGVGLPSESFEALYMEDVGDAYSFDRSIASSMANIECLPRFNSGLVLLAPSSLSFDRINSVLSYQGFWQPDGAANYYAEMTILVMELSRCRTKVLPTTYAIAPHQPGTDGMVCCHYCGGVYAKYLFYCDGIPALRESLLQSGHLGSESK